MHIVILPEEHGISELNDYLFAMLSIDFPFDEEMGCNRVIDWIWGHVSLLGASIWDCFRICLQVTFLFSEKNMNIKKIIGYKLASILYIFQISLNLSYFIAISYMHVYIYALYILSCI